MNTAVRYALCAVICLPISAVAADDVIERAVPGPLSPLQQQVPRSRNPLTAPTMEQQLAALQQQVQTLQMQVSTLQSVLKVTPTETTLQAPILILHSLNATTIRSNQGIAITAGSGIAVQSQTNTSIKAAGSATVETSGTMELKGALLKLNGGTKPLATVGSDVLNGKVVNGSQTISGN